MVLRAEIVSPEKRCVDREVDMVVVPGTEGDIAAMAGRTPVMLQLRTGLVSLHQDGKILERLFVSGGFADLVSDRCTILADSVRTLDELSHEDAQSRLDALEKEFSLLKEGESLERKTLSKKIRSVKDEIRIIESLS